MNVDDARQLWNYALSQFLDLGPTGRGGWAATLLTYHSAWTAPQQLWQFELSQTWLPRAEWALPNIESVHPGQSNTVPKWLEASVLQRSAGFLDRTQSGWNRAQLVQSGFLASRQLAGSDGGQQEITQKAGLLSDLQVVALSEGHAHIEQKGGWQNDQQIVVAKAGEHHIEQIGGRGQDSQRVQIEGGSHRIHQVGGQGADGQKVTVYGDGDSEILLEGGIGEDVQEVYLRGTGRNQVVIRGGEGDDTLKACGGFGSDTIVLDGGEGDDLIVYRLAPPFTPVGAAGNNQVEICGGPESSETNQVLIYQEGHALEIFADERRIYSHQADVGPKTVIRLTRVSLCRIVLEDLSELELKVN